MSNSMTPKFYVMESQRPRCVSLINLKDLQQHHFEKKDIRAKELHCDELIFNSILSILLDINRLVDYDQDSNHYNFRCMGLIIVVERDMTGWYLK